MSPPTLGELELEVLRYVTDHPNVTVREVAQTFGEPHGLARTTILTVMENLRRKGHLTRVKGRAAFVYAPAVPKSVLMGNLLNDFLNKTLRGSVSPVVAWLTNVQDISDDEVAELEKLVEDLRARKSQAPSQTPQEQQQTDTPEEK